jgi:hypothetical protein
MRFARRAPLLLVALAALLAGCGGNQIAADEVTVDPPVLTIPTDEGAAPSAAVTGKDADADKTDEESTDADAEATAAATAEPGTGGGTAATPAPSGGGTGGAQAEATAAPTQAPAETGGAQADEGLDQFCADNPGAC